MPEFWAKICFCDHLDIAAIWFSHGSAEPEKNKKEHKKEKKNNIVLYGSLHCEFLP